MSKFTDQQYLKTDQYKGLIATSMRAFMSRALWRENSYGWFNWLFDTLLNFLRMQKFWNWVLVLLICGSCSSRIPAGWDI